MRFGAGIIFVLVVLPSLGKAETLNLGEQVCSDAAIIATIQDQKWQRITSDDPNELIMSGLDHITLHVRRVLFGAVKSKTMKVTVTTETNLNAEEPWKVFLQRSHDKWYVADCRRR